MTTPAAISTLHNLARDLLDHVRLDKDAATLVDAIAQLSYPEMLSQLTSDAIKKATYINLYNAFSTLFLKENPSLIATTAGRLVHFTSKKITLAGIKISLDDIEHNWLRKSKNKLGRGYLGKLRVSKMEREMRVDHPDPRIHFALNCGGDSCPPIRYYEANKIEDQLDLATASFLDTQVHYHAEEQLVTISRLFQWYIGDFSGTQGVIRFLRQYKKIPNHNNPTIKYRPYNWAVNVDAFVATSIDE